MSCFEAAKQLQVPVELLRSVHENGRLPVVNFAAGGVATPADAALMMQLGAEGVFVGSGIFKSGDPAKRAAAIVKAVTNYTDAKLIAELSTDLGEAMVGINENEIALLMAEQRQVKWQLEFWRCRRFAEHAAVWINSAYRTSKFARSAIWISR